MYFYSFLMLCEEIGLLENFIKLYKNKIFSTPVA